MGFIPGRGIFARHPFLTLREDFEAAPARGLDFLSALGEGPADPGTPNQGHFVETGQARAKHDLGQGVPLNFRIWGCPETSGRGCGPLKAQSQRKGQRGEALGDHREVAAPRANKDARSGVDPLLERYVGIPEEVRAVREYVGIDRGESSSKRCDDRVTVHGGLQRLAPVERAWGRP